MYPMDRAKCYPLDGYKICCAGKGCTNLAKIPLKIKFIDRTGFFCQSCANDLVRNELAIILGEQVGKPL